MKEGPNPSRKSFHPKVKQGQFGIVVAEWNSEITHTLKDGAFETLIGLGVPKENIKTFEVSGAFELPLGLNYLIEKGGFDALIGIGCLVKGETPHFHYISEVVSHRLSEMSVQHNLPIGFGLLTVNTYQQALDRAGGKYGNKGQECAEAVANLLSFKYEL
ncbi:MAG: 6,7-dimethyl-8-ribityllumazine synthase [Bacteroidia bacterium]